MNIGLRGTRPTWLLALLFLLSACATSQNLSDEDRKKISVARINSNVQKAPTMYYMGPGTGIVMAGGAVGGAVLAATSVEPAKAFQDFAEKNGIFIEKIAFEEIDAALRQSGKIKVSDSAEATEATINVLVYFYGYSIPNGFSSNLVPVLGIRCEMVDATGKVVWRASDDVQVLKNPANAMKLEAMQANPRYIEDGWRRAAKRIGGNIARTL
jgi:hypothetical protein